MKTLTVTQAARNFSDLINRVQYQNLSVELVKSKRVVAVISPALPNAKMKAGDLPEFFSSLPHLAEDSVQFLKDMQDIDNALPKAVDKWE